MGWRCVPPEALAWCELEGDIVVRNARTGSTHLAAALAADVMRALIDARAEVELGELVERIAGGARAIEEVLLDFERLGLAERVA